MNGQDERKLLLTRIAHEQVGRISAEFRHRQEITVETATAGGAMFMYAADQILVRTHEVLRVQEFLGRRVNASQVEDVIPGITLVHLAPAGLYARRPSVPDVLDRIDEEVGQDIAGPNHVLTVTPETGPCPATEPEEVCFEIEPSPGSAWRTMAATARECGST